ncbi:6-hydroxy-d-nicotine oxidase [Seiridium cupressi]
MLLFPASEIDKVMMGLTRVIEEAGNPDEFSGDCPVAQHPDHYHLPSKQARQSLAHSTPASFMATLDPMTSMSMVAKLRAFTMSGLSSELASILAQNPTPTLASMVIAHRSHGAVTFPHPTRNEDPVTKTSSMPIRDPHTILAITGSALPGEFQKCVRWVDQSSNQIVEASLDLPRTYVNWTSNGEADIVRLYGKEISKRSKKLKSSAAIHLNGPAADLMILMAILCSGRARPANRHGTRAPTYRCGLNLSEDIRQLSPALRRLDKRRTATALADRWDQSFDRRLGQHASPAGQSQSSFDLQS